MSKFTKIQIELLQNAKKLLQNAKKLLQNAKKLLKNDSTNI